MDREGRETILEGLQAEADNLPNLLLTKEFLRTSLATSAKSDNFQQPLEFRRVWDESTDLVARERIFNNHFMYIRAYLCMRA